MSKRFTATEKWDDSWFCSLVPLDKLFWLYITDKCDSAGLWDVNEPLVKFHLGNEYHIDPERFDGRIVVLTKDKWFIPKFISFQYGTLKPECRPHAHVLSVLKKHSLKGYLKGIDTLKDKDKDKDKDKETEKDKRFSPPTLEEVRAYCLEQKNGVDPEAFLAHYNTVGWVYGRNKVPVKCWKSCVTTWKKKRSGMTLAELNG